MASNRRNSDTSRLLSERLSQLEVNPFELLAELYGDHRDYLAVASTVEKILERSLSARPTLLSERDEQLRAKRSWINTSGTIGYKAYIDRFSGDFDGVKAAIPHLRSLGVNYLHLIGVLKPRQGLNDGGFAIESYSAVNPLFGSIKDFEGMVNALHKNEIALSIDFVFNHVSDTHEWAQQAALGCEKHKAYFFTFNDRTEPDRIERSLGDVFPQSAPGNFVYCEQGGFWVWSTFHKYQWDLNYQNPVVFQEMLSNMLDLANRGIDIFRMDAAAFLWKEPGTDCKDLPKTHMILRAFRWFLAIVAPCCRVKAEAITSASNVANYFGANGNNFAIGAQLSYHAPLMTGLWYALAREESRQLATMMQDIGIRPKGATWITYARCHDDIGWSILNDEKTKWSLTVGDLEFVSSFYNGENVTGYSRGQAFELAPASQRKTYATNGTAASLAGLELAHTQKDGAACELAVDRLLLLYSFLYAYNGVPMLFMGEEIGVFNHYKLTRDLVDDSRELHRPNFDWELLQWIKNQETDSRHRLYTGLCGFAQLRKNQLHFTETDEEKFESLCAESVLGYQRRNSVQGCVFLGNFSSRNQTVLRSELMHILKEKNSVDLISGQIISCDSNLTMNPYQSMWVLST